MSAVQRWYETHPRPTVVGFHDGRGLSLFNRHLNGETMVDLAKDIGVSPPRVRQLIYRTWYYIDHESWKNSRPTCPTDFAC
jgi:hypothetical protein